MLLEVLVLVHDGMDVVHQGLPKNRNVLVLVVQLLLVVCRGKPLPREGVDEQGMLLQILLQSVLLRYDPRVVVVLVDIVLQAVVGGGVRHVPVGLVLAVLRVVQLLVGEVVEGEVARGRGRVHRAPLARREAQHGSHLRFFSARTS